MVSEQINPWEHTEAGDPEHLLYLTQALTSSCNYRCTFCSRDERKGHFDAGFLRSIADQAISLGMKKIELTGGEPLIFPGIADFAEYLGERGVRVLMVSNGSLLTRDIARRFAKAGVCFALSISTFDEKKYDRMTGTTGNLKKVLEGIRIMREAGYGRKSAHLMAIQSVASRENMNEWESLRSRAEEEDCLFILNRPIPVGKMKMQDLISPEELKSLLGSDPRTPFYPDSPCNRLAVGCSIGIDGHVRPCPCIDISAGSVFFRSLEDIWKNSPVLKMSRAVNKELEGSCGKCAERHGCYGCRAVAYSVFGKINAPDPGCFRYNADDYQGAMS